MTGSHGGGDLRLVEDFVRVLQGEQPSISCTNINDSLNGHLAVFRAEKSRRTGTVAGDASAIKRPVSALLSPRWPSVRQMFLLLHNISVTAPFLRRYPGLIGAMPLALT